MSIFGRGPAFGDRSSGDRSSRRDRRRLAASRRTQPATQKRETERRVQVAITVFLALAALVVIGVGAYGYWDTSVKPKQEAVLGVGSRTFDMGYMERRLAYIIRNAIPGEDVLSRPEAAVSALFGDVREEELNRLGAPELGITVTEDEIDAEIRRDLRIPETADSDAFAEGYRNAVRESGLHPNEYREVVAARILKQKLQEHFFDQVTATAEQVHLRVISVVTEEEANQVIARAQAGEDFAALAVELSLDVETKTNGGDLDWVPRGALAPDVETAAFALAAGQISAPVPIQGGFNVYQALEKVADKELSAEQRQDVEQQLYAAWQAGVAQLAPTTIFADQSALDRLVQKAANEGSGATGGQQ